MSLEKNFLGSTTKRERSENNSPSESFAAKATEKRGESEPLFPLFCAGCGAEYQLPEQDIEPTLFAMNKTQPPDPGEYISCIACPSCVDIDDFTNPSIARV